MNILRMSPRLKILYSKFLSFVLKRQIYGPKRSRLNQSFLWDWTSSLDFYGAKNEKSLPFSNVLTLYTTSF